MFDRIKISLQSRLPLIIIATQLLSACVIPWRARRQAEERVGSLQTKKLVDTLKHTDSIASADTQDTTKLESTSPTIPKDTLADTTRRVDSLVKGKETIASADTVKKDSVEVEEPRAGFDDIIEYKAKDSVVMLGTNMVYMFGPSTVDYKDKGLEGEYMRMNIDSNLVYAHYTLDSLGNPAKHPKFKDGDQSYEAKTMNYNFKTGKGFITGVVTQQGEGYVVAERTKKSGDNCMYMEGGRYSTCSNHEHPHFYLQLTRAKVRTGKNIVAGPSYLVIAGVPLPIGLPFGFFPFSSSYSSGILMPSYGEESSRGLYLREGGYYFAINDYADLAVTGDWYSRGSWGLNARSNYRKRYRYNGALSASYIVTVTGDKDVAGTYSKSTDFRISWNHSQDAKANPNQTFSASVNYSTSSYNHNSLNTLYNPGQASQNTKSSSISYTRTFGSSPFSLSASLDAIQTSSNQMVSLNSPNLSVNMSRIYPFKRKNRVGSERWYEKISMSYSGQLRNSISTHEDSIFKKSLVRDWQNGISHSIPISASYKLLDYIDLTLSASYNERWYTSHTEKRYDAATNQVVDERKYGFNRAYDFSTSASMSTTAYGFFKPWKLFGNKVQMIRHRMTPSIGVSYRPDFGEDMWGYYRDLNYTTADGKSVHTRYNIYEGQIFGAPSMGKSASINFSLDNNIEAKVRSIDAKDSTEVYKKVSIIDNFALSTSYNLAADSFKLSDISARIALKITKGLTLNLSGSFDPYVTQAVRGSDGNLYAVRMDKLRVLNGQGFGSLRGTGTSFSYTLNNDTFKKLRNLFSGKKDKEEGNEKKGEASNNKPTEEGSLGEQAKKAQQSNASLYGQSDGIQYDGDGYVINPVPWSVSFSYGVNLNRANFNLDKNEFDYRLNHSLMVNGSIQPTKNWNFNFSTSYDFEANRIANMTIGITRDLHCWSFTASAIPFGPYKSYNFTVGVKSSLLRDIKYDKHSYSVPDSWY